MGESLEEVLGVLDEIRRREPGLEPSSVVKLTQAVVLHHFCSQLTGDIEELINAVD